jgi:hypothetical protein
MMLHVPLHWPDVDDETLWPLALNHAAYLNNHTPNPVNGIAPIEIFSRTRSDCTALCLAHPWGCPVYVLEPRLTSAGGKIPKWQPRSCRGQYVGGPQFMLTTLDWSETFKQIAFPPSITLSMMIGLTLCMLLKTAPLQTGTICAFFRSLRQCLKRAFHPLLWLMNGSHQRKLLTMKPRGFYTGSDMAYQCIREGHSSVGANFFKHD